MDIPPSTEYARNIDAVLAFCDTWIEEATGPIPALGTEAWLLADGATVRASIAVWITATIVETDPAVVAGRLAAEVAELRRRHLQDMRQASQAISAGADWVAQANRPDHAELTRRRAG